MAREKEPRFSVAPEGQIPLAGHLINERHARQVLKHGPSVEEIRAVYSPRFADQDLVKSKANSRYAQIYGLGPLYFGNTFATQRSDVFNLVKILELADSETLVRTHLKVFQDLLEDPSETVENMFLPRPTAVINRQPWQAMTLAIVLAFSPLSEREIFYRHFPVSVGWGIVNNRAIDALVKSVPDLLDIPTTEKRFDAVTRMLTFPHNEALAEVSKGQDSGDYLELHRKAGMLIANTTIFGILTDRANGGKNNAFSRPDHHTTELEQCPAPSFVSNWYEGVGLALKDNREELIKAMENKGKVRRFVNKVRAIL